MSKRSKWKRYNKKFRGKKAKPGCRKKQYLYAIGDGENVKLGMSNNPKTRLVGLQTSNPKRLCLLWDMYISYSVEETLKAEDLLHDRCREFKVRGEWFKIKCMPLVADFNRYYAEIKNNRKIQQEIEDQLEIVHEARKYI